LLNEIEASTVILSETDSDTDSFKVKPNFKYCYWRYIYKHGCSIKIFIYWIQRWMWLPAYNVVWNCTASGGILLFL